MRFQGLPDATSRAWRWVAGVATAAAVAAIVSTYGVFNNAYDEPAHIAAGMEWLSSGTYALEPQHPPLSRVASALLPWLAGDSAYGNSHLYTEGRLILGRGAHYERTLALARLGQLPFLVVLVFVVWAWTRRLADERAAAIAVGFVVTNPNVLAHAGIAGTDIGPAALMPAALLAWVLWLEDPSTKRSLLLGVAVALCGLTKFSAGAFWLPAAILVAVVYTVRHPGRMMFLAGGRRMFRPFLVAFGTAGLITWAAYRFSVGPVESVTLPAPEFWAGLRQFFAHGTGGHPAYLFGEVRLGGWWYYDLVALAVKTPLPLLLLGVTGDAISMRRWRVERGTYPLARVALFAGMTSVLLVAMLTPVDIGVRLVLPAYAMMSVLAALAAAHILTAGARWARVALAATALWAVAIPVASHPDHLAYFNPLAGREPAKVLVDSNLDWGQDLYRLRNAVRDIGMDSLRVHYFGTAEFAAVGLERTRRLRPDERATGWVAASETFYRGVWADSSLAWLRAHQPVRQVGKSIRLYFIPPSP